MALVVFCLVIPERGGLAGVSQCKGGMTGGETFKWKSFVMNLTIFFIMILVKHCRLFTRIYIFFLALRAEIREEPTKNRAKFFLFFLRISTKNFPSNFVQTNLSGAIFPPYRHKKRHFLLLVISWLSPLCFEVLLSSWLSGALSSAILRRPMGSLRKLSFEEKKGIECFAHFFSLKDVFRFYSSVSIVLARFWPFRLSSSPSPCLVFDSHIAKILFCGFPRNQRHISPSSPREIVCNEEREVIRGSWLTKVVMRISMLISR